MVDWSSGLLVFWSTGRRVGWTLSFDRRVFYLFLLDPLILFHGFGGDGCGRFGGVVLLHVSGGSGDGSPSLARTKPNGDTTEQ